MHVLRMAVCLPMRRRIHACASNGSVLAYEEAYEFVTTCFRVRKQYKCMLFGWLHTI